MRYMTIVILLFSTFLFAEEFEFTEVINDEKGVELPSAFVDEHLQSHVLTLAAQLFPEALMLTIEQRWAEEYACEEQQRREAEAEAEAKRIEELRKNRKTQ
jgi:hypothetical protein